MADKVLTLLDPTCIEGFIKHRKFNKSSVFIISFSKFSKKLFPADLNYKWQKVDTVHSIAYPWHKDLTIFIQWQVRIIFYFID